MRSWLPYLEYMTEARAEVCGRCPQRTADQFPFGAECWRCGIELQLPELVDAIHAAETGLPAGPAPDQHKVCARCLHLRSARCPCAVEALTDVLVRAVRAVDARREQRCAMRRVLRRQPRKQRFSIRPIIQAYEEATGTCVCCD